MPWAQLVADRKVRPHTTSLQETEDLRSVVDMDLTDAAIAGLSSDRRFATAYNAALQLARIAIACAGYRTTGSSHHQTAFEALELALGPAVAQQSAYFETCRRKRNVVDYDMAYMVSLSEAEEILAETKRLRETVEAWMAANYPHLMSPQS